MRADRHGPGGVTTKNESLAKRLIVIPAFDRLIFGQSQEGTCLFSSILHTQNGFSYLVLVSILLDLLPLCLSDDMSCS
jgi:hypothetical protein